MRPYRAGDEDDGDAHQADLRAGDAQPIVFRLAFPDVKKVSEEAYKESRFAGPSRRCMEIENALDQAHGAFRRSNEERGISRRAHQEENRGPGDRTLSHVGYSSRRYSPKSHSAVKKTTSKTARKPMPFHETNGSRSKMPLVTSVLATKTGVSRGSRSSGKSSSRMRACAEMADSA